MSARNYKQIVLQYLQIAMGTTVLALGVYLFFMPHNLVVGGVSGLGIIILHYSETHLPFAIPVWLTNLAINIPLAVIALIVMGRKFLAKTIFAFHFLIRLIFARGVYKHHPRN